MFSKHSKNKQDMELKEYNLPEWCFLDGYSHQGNTLEGREVIIHTPSMTILEVICLDDKDVFLNEGVQFKDFTYNSESFRVAVYKSLQEDVSQLINQAIDWYKKEVDFMNKQILHDN